MARYRKVSVRIWADAKVRQLSAPAPNGRDCWLYLMTAKESTNIPGLVPAGAAAIAETLRWSVDGFLAAFSEVAELGLAQADWDAGLVWLPNAIRHNPPESPNVVRAWAETWEDLVPECPLREVAYLALRAACESKGPGFVEAFDEAIPRPEAFPEPSRKPSPKASPKPSANPPESLPEALPQSGAVTGTGAVTGGGSSPAPEVSASTPRPTSDALAFWLWAQEERTKATGLVREKQLMPTKLGGWYSATISELGGNERRLHVAYAKYLLQPRDDYWRNKGFPFNGFMARWAEYAPPAEVAA